MRKVFVLLFSAALMLSTKNVKASDSSPTYIQTPVSAVNAHRHVGQNRIVCGKVEQVTLKKYGAFINMGNFEELPNGTVILSPSFTAIVWENDRVNLEINPKQDFLGKESCFSGVISSSPTNRYTYERVPQIIIRELNQIKQLPKINN